MSRSLEETLVAFAEKYQGDFKEIFKAVAYKERLTDNEIDKLNDNVDEKYVTVMSEDYPEVLKGIDCPPIVMFYEGNMDLVSEEVYEIASPLDKSKRVFFKLDITNDGMDYFRRLYYTICGEMPQNLEKLKTQNFTVREIAILTKKSKSGVSRELKEVNLSE